MHLHMAVYPYNTSISIYTNVKVVFTCDQRSERGIWGISVVTIKFYFGNTNIPKTNNMDKFKIYSIWVVGTQIFLCI